MAAAVVREFGGARRRLIEELQRKELGELERMVGDDRPLVEALMERCLEYGLAYARALSDTGADMLSGGDSPAGLISPSFYAQIVQPVEARAVRRLERMCAQQ